MQFGGSVDRRKAGNPRALSRCLTTALKSTPFKLVYIDAFAGTGLIDLQEDRDAVGFRGDCSTRRAIQIRDKPFDELVFIEKDPARCAHLEKLRDEYPGRRITVENSEANHGESDLRRASQATSWIACSHVHALRH